MLPGLREFEDEADVGDGDGECVVDGTTCPRASLVKDHTSEEVLVMLI